MAQMVERATDRPITGAGETVTDLNVRMRRQAWRSKAVLSGFTATGTMTVVLMVAYALSGMVPYPTTTTPVYLRWIWALVNNPITHKTSSSLPLLLMLHVAAGMVWALLYAGFAEPRLRGPGWRRGVVFSFVPWAFSVLFFLPMVGGGPLGIKLGAGPFPVWGNLVLHLVFGAVLGHLYGPAGDRFETEAGVPEHAGDRALAERGEQAFARWIPFGLGAGVIAAWVLTVVVHVSNPALVLASGAIAGSLLGASVGSFAGRSDDEVAA